MELRNFSTGGFVLFARTFGKVFIKYLSVKPHTFTVCGSSLKSCKSGRCIVGAILFINIPHSRHLIPGILQEVLLPKIPELHDSVP